MRKEFVKSSARQVQKKYDAIKASVCADNRVRGLLPLARETVKNRQADKLRVLFGSTMDTLSQLIRTAFVDEASASQMFGVPIEKISKGNSEYSLRQRGKVAERS